MTLAADPIVGSTRVVVLAPETSDVRGEPAEFRRFGLSIVIREDILQALTEVARDANAALVVSSELACADVRDVIDLAVAACRSSVILGISATTDIALISFALQAGVRSTVEMPLTPERLSRTLRAIPTGTATTGPIVVGSLSVDTARHRIEWAGHPVQASPREFAVLRELAHRHPHMVTLDELAAGYGGAASDTHSAVRVIINHLRSRIAEVAGESGHAVIETVRGVGYRLTG
jgi:DNA-binding response OmpR family regulator